MIKKSFTLAEVLITLTIIGVIAAITIPTLMKNYEKRQIEVGLAKTYQELSNVIKRSEVDNGPFEDWELPASVTSQSAKPYIDKYFAPYMSLTPCNDKCFSGKISSVTYMGSYLCPNGTLVNTPSATYFLPDGRTFQFFRVIKYDWINAKYIEFVVDVNGRRGKSVLGEDVFGFVIGSASGMPKGLQTGGSGSGYGYSHASKEKLYTMCSPTQTSFDALINCSIILQRNGWKFPDDYPIKF